MANTKKQHTVTRAYLARWANRAGIAHVFDLSTGQQRRENVTNVCAQNYFYSPPDGMQEFERALANVETFWMATQQRIIGAATDVLRSGRPGPRVIYEHDEEQLADSVVQQLVRTTRVRKSFARLGKDEARLAHAELMTRPDVVALARQIRDGVWLLFADEEGDDCPLLYTSDQPVVVVPLPADPSAAALRVKGFMLSLSPAHLLVNYAPGTSGFTRDWNGRLVRLDETRAIESNTLQIGNAEQVVLSATPDFSLARRWFDDHHPAVGEPASC